MDNPGTMHTLSLQVSKIARIAAPQKSFKGGFISGMLKILKIEDV
jgi:hypothetical protein